jgi:hypothetical protein
VISESAAHHYSLLHVSYDAGSEILRAAHDFRRRVVSARCAKPRSADRLPGWDSRNTSVSVTAYYCLGGKVETSNEKLCNGFDSRSVFFAPRA